MMKKIWNQYSFAIILILLSCTLAVILSVKQNGSDQDSYIKITVSEGDSLWEISDQYSGWHSLSNKEFISWVRKHNTNVGDEIFPGEKIIIPVSRNSSISSTELASALEE